MSLQKYWSKRDFGKTPEPRGKSARAGKQLSFFIQKHDARRLHYDFRLELGGTLKSWAVPKGPSLDPSEKRLAVHVEDHPIEYGIFEGAIPTGQYGAGDVEVWDRGTWTPVGDAEEGLRKGRLKFRLEGEKLSGGWTLVRMGPAKTEKENWLLIKEKDEAAKSGEDAEITLLQPDSVLAKPTRKAARKAASAAKATAATAVNDETIVPAGGNTRKAESGSPPARKATKNARKKVPPTTPRSAGEPAALAPETVDGAREAPMPDMIAPQLATLADAAPEGDNWLSEVKFDGYRVLCRVEEGKATLFTRAGNDWTAKWPAVAQALARLPVQNAWLDGETVAIDEDGAISFQRLQNLMRDQVPARLACYLFDLPYLNGVDLRAVPLLRRKEILAALLAGAAPDSPLLYSDHLNGSARDVYSHACMHGMEGIIAKRADSPYESGRNRSWLKVKCQQRQEFVIGAYTDPAGSREKFGALLLGVMDEQGALRYAGRVGTGFSNATLQALSREFKKLASDTPPFANPPRRAGQAAIHWLRPELVAEVTFAQWTDGGLVRHASFDGLRSDKAPTDIRREEPVPVAVAEAGAETSTGAGKRSKGAPAPNAAKVTKATTANKADKAGKDSATGTASAPATAAQPTSRGPADTVAGVRLTHPARILFPATGITKLRLAQYYEEIGDWILPHIVNRPLTLVRCPQGEAHQCFFQKHAGQGMAEGVEPVRIPGAKGDAETNYMMANSVPALAGLVQMGTLELHTWGASKGQLDRPDRMIFDLDPAEGLPWSDVVEAAQLIRTLLEEIGLTSFVKTTGGKGLHVVVPLKPDRPWEEVKAFSRALAEHMEKLMPDRFTSKMAKAKRTGKIFIDYLRNAEEATAVAAYSTRARAGAPVSTPLAWEELEDKALRSDTYTLQNLGKRLNHLKHDPWEGYFDLKQRITAKMLRTFGL